MSTWKHRLGIRVGEERLVVGISAVFAVTQSTHAFAANASDALFFLRYGVDRLPLMILLSGFAVMAALIVHMAGLGHRGPVRWLPRVTAVCGLWAFVNWAASFTDLALTYPFIWISSQVLIMVTFTVMWNAAAAASTTRQAKRLYPLFASAGVAGAILGNLATGPLASLLRTEVLLAIQGLGLSISALLLARVSSFFTTDLTGVAPSIREDFAGALGTIRSSRLLRLAVIASFGFSVLFFLVVFPFNEVVAASYATEAEVARFLGLFASVATGLTFAVSLVLINRLFARLGIVVTLLILPIVYVAGFSLWLGNFNLTTAAFVRSAQWVAVNAIGATAMTAMYNVVTGRRRGQVISFMTAVPGQIGVVTGGAILIFATKLGERGLVLIGLVIAAGSFLVVLQMKSAYVVALVTAVRKGLVGVFDAPQEGLVSPFGGESIQVLSKYLKSSNPEERTMAVTALSSAGASNRGQLIAPLMNDEDPGVRAAAFDSMCAVLPEEVPSLAAEGLHDESPEMRKRVLRMLGANPTNTNRTAAATLLDDPDPTVRAAAAVVVGDERGLVVLEQILETNDPPTICAVLDEIASAGSATIDPAPYLIHEDPDVRVSATRLARVTWADPSSFKDGLEDPSMMVRHVTADALSVTDEGRDILFQVLDEGSVSASEVALRALTPVGRFTDDFLAWAAREAARARSLADLATAIRSEPMSLSSEFLQLVLTRRSQTLCDWVILAMTTEETTEVMSVVERGLFSADVETRAQALEGLEAIGDRSLSRVLISLLDAEIQDSQLTQSQALQSLTRDFDPWLSILSRRSLEDDTVDPAPGRPSGYGSAADDVADFEAMPADSIDTLNLVDRVIALQRVPMFSGLDPEDLRLVAIPATEINYHSGETIYHVNEEGGEMMVIIEGDVVVTAEHDGATKEIARYGNGEHVGELALLQGATRSADVTAGDEGVFALIIDKVDLISILQERPTVALAMLGTLASRLAAQT